MVAAKEGRPIDKEYRGTLAATSELQHRCLRKSELLLSKPQMWEFMPRDGLLRRLQATAFRMLSRLRCSVYQLLVAEHDRWSTKVFALIKSDLVADELDKAPPCVRGRFVQEFYEKFEGNLTSVAAKAFLEAILVYTSHDVAQIESRHASIRRWLTFKSLQTHVVDFASLSSEWLLMRLRRHLKRAKAATPGPTSDAQTTGTTGAGSASGVASRGVKRKRGGGGQHRAYISLQCRQRKLKLDQRTMTELGNEYRELTPQQKQRMQLPALAKRATKSWKTARKGVSAFGTPKMERQRRLAARKLRESLWGRFRALPPKQRGAALIQAIDLRNPLDPSAIAEALRTARAQVRLERQAQRHQDACCEKLLSEWRASEGKACLDILQAAAPGGIAPEIKDNLVVSPGKFINIVEADCSQGHRVPDVASLIHGVRGSRLEQAVVEDFNNRHKTISEKECPPLPEPAAPADAKHSQCLGAGRCLCTAEGRRLRRFRVAFYQALAVAWKRGSKTRELTSEGQVFLHFRSAPGMAKHGLAAKEVDWSGAADVWVHIGLMYWSPVRPTFAQMALLDKECATEEGDAAAKRVLLGAEAALMTEWELFSRMDMEHGWFIDIYLLDNTLKPISHFNPGRVWAERYSEELGLQMWPTSSGGGFDKSESDQDTDAEEDRNEPEKVIEDLVDDGNQADGDEGGDAEGTEADVIALGAVAAEAPPDADMDIGDLADAEGSALQEGGIGEATDVGPPPVPHAVGPAERRRRQRDANELGARASALASVMTTGGTIGCYRSGKFQAVCSNPFHGACILTRANTKRAAWKGRPVASMVLWLELGNSAETKQEHWALLEEVEQSRDARIGIRAAITADPDFASVLEHERALDEGEVDEP